MDDPQEWDASGKPIKASIAPAQHTEWDASGKPITPAPAAEPTLWDKAKANFNAGTQHVPTDTSGPIGLARSVLQNAGAQGGDVVRDLYHAVVPYKANPQAQAAYDALTPEQKLQQRANETVGQGERIMHDPVAALASSAGGLGTGAIIGGAAAEGAGLAGRGLSSAANSTIDAASSAKAYLRPKSSPAIVPPEEIQAQKIAQSILPPGGIKPEMVKAIRAQAPAIAEYAQRTGNPLNTQAEGMKAAQGVAQEGLAHFNEQILKPVSGERINLADITDLGTKATLGQIADEITALNKKVDTAKAPNSGAVGMLLEKGGVQDQLNYLRSVLYENLAKRTGIPAEDLQTLREGYGGQFSVANALESAQNARMTRTGQVSQGQQTIAGQVPTSLADIPGKAWKWAKGGEQAIADRQFSSAMKDVQAAAPDRPVPNPPEIVPALRNPPIRGGSTSLPTTDYTPDPNARQIMADRIAARKTAPAEPVVKGMQKWADAGADRIAQHIATDPSSGLTPESIEAAGKTPAGRQLLIKASGITPGSRMMSDIVQQIKKLGVSQ